MVNPGRLLLLLLLAAAACGCCLRLLLVVLLPLLLLLRLLWLLGLQGGGAANPKTFQKHDVEFCNFESLFAGGTRNSPSIVGSPSRPQAIWENDE